MALYLDPHQKLIGSILVQDPSSSKFCGNLLSSFCVILLTTNQQMHTGQNITPLAEVLKLYRLFS